MRTHVVRGKAEAMSSSHSSSNKPTDHTEAIKSTSSAPAQTPHAQPTGSHGSQPTTAADLKPNPAAVAPAAPMPAGHTTATLPRLEQQHRQQLMSKGFTQAHLDEVETSGMLSTASGYGISFQEIIEIIQKYGPQALAVIRTFLDLLKSKQDEAKREEERRQRETIR